jgi:peptidoglycan/xylan/chitin deacetylase (PgdA/CDA1 family)
MRKFIAFVGALIGAPFLCLVLSANAVHFGDNAFLSDRLLDAKAWYSVAELTNPFNPQLPNRLLAINVNLEERLNPNEETADVPKNLAKFTTSTQVLGITSCVPVLMYHYIRVNPWPTDTVGAGLSTPPYMFAQELDYLQSKGYETITLSDLKSNIELYKAIEIRKKNPDYKLPRVKLLPTKPLLITLDDGYKDAYTQALPILREHGMNAVEFVITGFVGLPNYLDWDDITAMDKSGIFEIESHTVHHYALGGTYWDPSVVNYELRQSKKDLESHLGKTVEWFAYPYGSVNDFSSHAASKVYYAAFGTNLGAYQSTEEEYTLPRIRIGGGDNGQSVDEKIQDALTHANCVH